MPKLLTLREAAAYLHGKFTPRAILRLVKQGRIPVTIISRKMFLTPEDLDTLIVNSKVTMGPLCRVDDYLHGSTSGRSVQTTDQPGSFSTERKRLAQAAAEMSVRKLSKPSKPTLRKATNHRVVSIARARSSARKS